MAVVLAAAMVVAIGWAGVVAAAPPGWGGPGPGWGAGGGWNCPAMERGMGPGMGRGAMMGRGMGRGMGWGPGAGAPAASPAEAITEERAKEIATEYVGKYLPGYTVERVLPFQGRFRTAYQVELKGPAGEARTIHVNPWGQVRPFGAPFAAR
jgi:hypothetical protein